jgi:hypothetical protein
MHTKFGEEIEILKPMFNETERLTPPFKSYVVMGQVCVAKNIGSKEFSENSIPK